MAKKLTQQEVINKIRNMYNGEYQLLSTYTLANQPITLKHICGKEYTINHAKSFLTEGEGKCPICCKPKSHSTKKLTEQELINRIKTQRGNEYTYLGGFISNNEKIKVRHNICNNEFEITPHMFTGSRLRGCPICANNNRGKYQIDTNYLQKLLDDKEYGNEYEWKDSYQGDNKMLLNIYHKVCNNTYQVRPNDFQQGYQCPYCTRLSSNGELDMKRFLESFYNGNIIQHYRYEKKGLEIDFYVPDKKIGFEFDGTYWHSTKVIDDKNTQLKKYNYFKDLGIKVYFINEDDWYNKTGILKSKIKHILGYNDIEKIYARNTTLKYNIPAKEYKEFLNNNHIQGYCHDNFNFGLYYNNTLIAFMSFAYSRNNVNNKNNRLELLRYATDINYRIIGGFSKLLKHSIIYIKQNYPEYSCIYSFADISLTNGNVYEKNGFVLDHICKPSYFYIYKHKKINRYNYRKSELKKKFPQYYNENLTEFEITEKIPSLYRIYNCGNFVYRYDIK